MNRSQPKFLACWLIVMPVLVAADPAAAAGAPLTDYNGRWSGTGTDRDMPFSSPQQTQCRAQVNNDAAHMNSEIVCNGAGGLNKRTHISLVLSGDQLTGTTEQVSQAPGGEPVRRAGRVTGEQSGAVTSLVISFSGLTPNASVVLQRQSASTFSMRVSAMGATLTEVQFRRR